MSKQIKNGIVAKSEVESLIMSDWYQDFSQRRKEHEFKQYGNLSKIVTTVGKIVNMDLMIYQEAQRKLDSNRSKKIAEKYILEATYSFIDEIMARYPRSLRSYWKFPSLLAFTLEGKTYILDGQHRLEGMKYAVDKLQKIVKKQEDMINYKHLSAQRKEKLKYDYTRNREALAELFSHDIGIDVYENLPLEMAQQLFVDINATPKKVNPADRIPKDHADIYSVITTLMMNQYKEYVTLDKKILANVGSSSEQVFLPQALYQGLKKLTQGIQLDESCIEFWTKEFSTLIALYLNHLPSDYANRGRYVFSDQRMFVALASYANKAKNRVDDTDWKQSVKYIMRSGLFDKRHDVYRFYADGNGSIGNGSGSGMKRALEAMVAIGFVNEFGHPSLDAYGAKVSEEDVEDVAVPDLSFRVDKQGCVISTNEVTSEPVQIGNRTKIKIESMLDRMSSDQCYTVFELHEMSGLERATVRRYAELATNNGKLIKKTVDGTVQYQKI